jgi:hypothetical protein
MQPITTVLIDMHEQTMTQGSNLVIAITWGTEGDSQVGALPWLYYLWESDSQLGARILWLYYPMGG